MGDSLSPAACESPPSSCQEPRERGPRFTDSQLLRRRVVRREQSDILNG